MEKTTNSKSSQNIIKTIQNIVLEMFCDIDKFCSNNKITYFLSGGSCLGAIRHQGFIPWDDDGDIMLPRKDYELFIRNFEQYFPGKYKMGSLVTDPNWVRPASRIWNLSTKMISKKYSEEEMGVFVDVYPIDGLPDNKFRRWFLYKEIRILNALKNQTIQKEYGPDEKYVKTKKILSIFMRHFKPREFSEIMDKLACRENFYTSEYVGAILATHYWEKETIKRESVETSKPVLFENIILPVPIGYDEYLSNLYGDYMIIPQNANLFDLNHLSDGRIFYFNTDNQNKE